MGIEVNCSVLQNYRTPAFCQNSQRHHGRQKNMESTAVRKRASLAKNMGSIKVASVTKE